MSHEPIVGRASSRDGGDSGIGGGNSWGSIGGVNSGGGIGGGNSWGSIGRVNSGGGIGGGSSIGVNCGANHGVSGGVDRGASSVVMISSGSGNGGLVNWNTKNKVF